MHQLGCTKLICLNRYLPTPRLAGRYVLLLAFAAAAFLARAQHDLSIFRVSSDVFVNQGDIVSFTYVVTNDLGTDVTGVEVQIDLPAGLTYLQHTLSQNFDPGTGVWNIGNIAYYQPQRVITIDARVVGEGVLTANAEISAMDGTDSDSTPGNGELQEDDIVAVCVSVPIRAECGQSVRLEAPAGYNNYQWYFNNNEIVGATNAVLNVAESGNYNFQVGDLTTTCPLGSCCPAVVSFDSISVELSQPLVCTGGFDTVFVSVPDVDTINFVQDYTWASPDDPMLQFLSCATCAEPEVIINTPYLGDSLRYVLAVVTRDLAGNVVCSANATIVIEVLQAPVLTFDTPAYACAQEPVQISFSSDLATTYIFWDGPNLFTPDAEVMTYRPRQVADYKRETFVVTVDGVDGCRRVDSVDIISMPSFELVVDASQTICQFESATLTVSTLPVVAQDSLVYDWVELPGNINQNNNLAADDAATVVTNPLDPGVYGFRVSVQRRAPNGDLVCSYEADVEVQVQDDCAQPRLGGYAWKDANGDGFRQNYEAPMGGVNVELFASTGTTTGLTATTDAAGFYEFSDLPVGDYYVQFQVLPAFVFAPQNLGNDEFKDSDVDAAGRSDVFATTYDVTTHLVGAGYVADCQLAYVNVVTTPGDCGDPMGSLTFDVYGAAGNLTYTWAPDVSTTNSASGLVAGEYTITVYDDVTECEYTETLVVPGSSNFLLSTSSSPAACPMGKGGSITLFTDGGNPPFTIDFSGTDSGTLTANAMPFTIQDIRGGDYTISVTDATGCTQLDAIFVSENTLLLSIDTSMVVLAGCNGANTGSFVVEVAGFFSVYTLSINGLTVASNTAQPSVSIANQSAGLKTLEVIDANGCVQTFSFMLEDGSQPIDVANIVVEDVDCYGSATGSIASAAAEPYELRNSAGQFVGTLPVTGLTAGTYTLVDRSNPGCVTTADVIVAQPDALQLDLLVQGTGCGVDTGSIIVTVAGGTAPYRYIWADGFSNTNVRLGLASGTYTLRLEDANGCSRDTTVAVADLCEPLVCGPYFTADTLELAVAAGPYDYCFANFDVTSDRSFTLAGSPVSPAVCTRTGLVYYNLDALPGDGADGPYILEFWYGGDAAVIAQTLPDGAAFASVLDAADGWGRWIYDASDNTIRGGQPGRAYGEIEVTHVASGQRVYLTPQLLNNQLSGTVNLTSPGAYTIGTVDELTGCTDSLHIILSEPDACADALVPPSAFATTPYCSSEAPICINVPYALFTASSLTLDGVAYTGLAEPCAIDEVVYYDLAGLTLTPPLFIDAWTVDGRFESARASSLDELAARMRLFDTEPWSYDAVMGLLRGGNTSRVYSSLTLRSAGGTVQLSPKQDIADGTRIVTTTGVHAAALTMSNGCRSNFSVTMECSTQAPPRVDTLLVNIGVGYADTLCIATDELPGLLDVVINTCEDASGEYALVTQLDSTCFSYEGLEIGSDTLCVVACDINGVCDTTIVIISVLDPVSFLFPDAVADVDSLQMNGSKTIDLLRNDDINGQFASLEVVQYPQFGDATIVDNELYYTADPQFCGVDELIYELCNTYGCDTALVKLHIQCDELIIFSGFSPNYDDVNETFTVLGIEQYPGNRMEVYNRYGNLVFEQDEYDNSWRGTYFNGDELAEGTYFYIFEDGKGRTYTGYVYLKR